MLDYKLLEALEAVIHEGGFEKAAAALCLTQSAVSQRIKQLEDQSGQVLLIRSVPPRPTPAGKRMLKHCLQVRQLESDLANEVTPEPGARFASLAIGLNADSLSTWFMESIRPFLKQHQVVIDLRVDDQEQTHQLLRDGIVSGCISSRKKPVQGCTATHLGCETYRLLATPAFAEKWFPGGLERDRIKQAPAVIFNRKDELHGIMLNKLFKGNAPAVPAHYIPSPEQFMAIIVSDLAYGMVPDWQSVEMIQNGTLIDLAPETNMPVHLYWHCWNIRSNLLKALTGCIVEGAERLLGGLPGKSAGDISGG